MPRPDCPKCRGTSCVRVRREGLLQMLVYPRFGRFPWKCGGCHTIFLAERGKRKKRSGPVDAAEARLREQPEAVHLAETNDLPETDAMPETRGESRSLDPSTSLDAPGSLHSL